MSLEEKYKVNLIKYRLEQANETVSDVHLLIENNRLRSAVNRIYYGMFYALLALALDNDFETSKHGQLIGWFNKNFVNENKIDVKYGKIISKAFNRRTKGDYDAFIEFDKENIQNMYNDMKKFIEEIKSLIDI